MLYFFKRNSDAGDNVAIFYYFCWVIFCANFGYSKYPNTSLRIVALLGTKKLTDQTSQLRIWLKIGSKVDDLMLSDIRAEKPPPVGRSAG